MLDLNLLLSQIESVADQPPPIEFGRASINDFLLSCELTPLDAPEWTKVLAGAQLSKTEQAQMWEKKLHPPFTENQISIFAVWGLGTELYSRTRETLRTQRPSSDSLTILTALFQRLRGVPADIMARVRFRREEALRAWADAFSLAIAGETPEESRAKLIRLDFFGVMESARKAESAFDVKQRAATLKRMEQQKKAAAASAARGNYE